MDILVLSKLLNNERKAGNYFKKLRWPKGVICPECNSKKISKLSDCRYKCWQCSNRFSDFSNTYLSHKRIPFRKVLLLLKLFLIELTARKSAKEVGLSYKSCLSFFNTCRRAIYDHNLPKYVHFKGEIELDEAYFGGKRKGKRGRGAANKIPVFGIRERGSKVLVEPVVNVEEETLTKLTKNHVKTGSKTYTDKFRSYNSLIWQGYEHIRVDHEKRFTNGKTHINSIESFWAYAKERLLKYHGVSPQNFLFYLKELEWRFNHQKNPDLFGILAKYLTSLVRLST